MQRPIALLTTLAIGFAGGSVLTRALAEAPSHPVTPSVASPANTPTLSYDPNRSLAPLIDAVDEAVVTIEVARTVEARGVPDFPGLFSPWGAPPPNPGRPKKVEGQGSGFIVSADGLLVTNAHVIEDAEEIDVVLSDGERVTAQLLGQDLAIDVAVLRLDDDRAWPHVPFGDSEALQVGDHVVALGNGLGLGATATTGIVSGKGRKRFGGGGDDPRFRDNQVFGRANFIQTDATINPGNSGGPLFDLHGHVIGMNTAINTAYSPVSFAIPSQLIQDTIDELLESGRVSRGFLGVYLQPLTEAYAESFDVDADDGIVMSHVSPKAAAERAGVQSYDVVTEIDGERVATVSEFMRAIASRSAGDRVELTVHRNGKTKIIDATLDENPATARLSGARPQTDKPRQIDADGSFQPSRAERPEGVWVRGVPRGSRLRGKVSPGDLILEVDGNPVTDAEPIEQALQAGDEVVLKIYSDRGYSIVILPEG